ncbi:MAG: hypothetical protein NTZ10_04965 [Candidatus Saganbacteria bacterium]|nr:hypothetical protein [Candidatus Saganbacteria bacterium]
MEKNVNTDLHHTANGIPLMSLNENIMAGLEESLRKGQKIEFIPFKKWQAQRCEKNNCAKKEVQAI